MQDLNSIEEKLGYRFKDKNLLETALTHSSYANQYQVASNENLEFLGDAVLNYIVSTEIFKQNPAKNEQFLTELKSAYVNRNFLNKIGKELSLSKNIRHIGSINLRLDDFVESLIGAIYLDGGFISAKRFVKRFILKKQTKPLKDYKGLLQTIVNEKFGKIPVYKLEESSGPSHKRIFTVSVKIEGTPLKTIATGRTKKQAQLEAAKKLIEKIVSV